MVYPEYAGMSYERASREAARLIDRHGWFASFDRLAGLREIMRRDAVTAVCDDDWRARYEPDGPRSGVAGVISNRRA